MQRNGHAARSAARGDHAGRACRALAFPLALLCLVASVPGAVPGARVAPPSPYLQVDRWLARLTLQQKIGQLVMGPADGAEATGRLGGVIVFGADIVSPTQGRALLAAAQHWQTVPVLVAADQEGGSIDTMSDGGGVPPMLAPAQYGALGSPERVYHDALVTGRALRALGITMNLAPVLDVLVDPNSAIGSRSFGADPALVARLGSAAIRGYQDAGLAATAKHFLGLGASPIDAHQALPTDARTLRQLEADELVPMRAAIADGVDALMVTDVALPALDPTGTPAALSRPIITGFVRGRLGYQGLIITDSLAMGGLSAHIKSVQDAAVRAIEAGADMVIIPTDVPTVRITLTALDDAVFSGHIPLAALNASVRRILTLKARLGLLPR